MTTKNIILTEDTNIKDTYPTVNYGTDTTFVTLLNDAGTFESLLKCDLSSLSGKVNSATLYLYMSTSDAYTATIGIYPVTSTWAETVVTWNTKPTNGATWQDVSVNSTVGWKTWTLDTTTVQTWVNGGTNYGMLLYQSTSTTTNAYQKIFNSRENADYKPYILLDYNPTSMSFSVSMDNAIF